MNYKEFLYRQSVKNLDGLLIPKWIKNIAKSKLDDYFALLNRNIQPMPLCLPLIMRS